MKSGGGTTGSATHGFLFADLRGYTAFVERAGAHRAAAMLARYRDLVREQVFGYALTLWPLIRAGMAFGAAAGLAFAADTL